MTRSAGPAPADPTADAWHVLVVPDPLDVSTANRLRAAFVDLFADGHAHVVADLSDVTFVDSTGLGVLIGALKRARSGGGGLRLVHAQPEVRRLLRVTGLDRVLPVHEDLEAARSSEPEQPIG